MQPARVPWQGGDRTRRAQSHFALPSLPAKLECPASAAIVRGNEKTQPAAIEAPAGFFKVATSRADRRFKARTIVASFSSMMLLGGPDRRSTQRSTHETRIGSNWQCSPRTHCLCLKRSGGLVIEVLWTSAVNLGPLRKALLAERVRFELTVRLPAHRFSRPARSATPAPLRVRALLCIAGERICVTLEGGSGKGPIPSVPCRQFRPRTLRVP